MCILGLKSNIHVYCDCAFKLGKAESPLPQKYTLEQNNSSSRKFQQQQQQQITMYIWFAVTPCVYLLAR